MSISVRLISFYRNRKLGLGVESSPSRVPPLGILSSLSLVCQMATYCQTLQVTARYGVRHRKCWFLSNQFRSLCGAVEPPELPDWFKSSQGEGSSIVDLDDDFVLPTKLESLMGGASSQLVNGCKTHIRLMPSEIASDDETDEVSNILKNKFSSPEAVCLVLDACPVKLSDGLVAKILRRFSNDWIPAFGFFKWVNSQVGSEQKHNSSLYDMMVDILGKCKQFELMWGLVEQMLQIGGLVSLMTMMKVIRRLAGAGRWYDAIKTFHDLELFGVKRDTLSMNMLLDSLCKERSVKHARDAFFEMRCQIPPNASSFNILVHGWCKARKIEEARHALEEMKEFGFAPCVITYTCLVEAYCMEKNFNKVDEILFEMQTEGCPPNVVTYTIIMHSLGKSKQTQKALQVFRRMKRDGCIPDTSFYNSLLYILCRAGRLQEAYRRYEEMCENGIPPNVTTYNTIISASCDHSQEDNALKVLQNMERSSCKPDIKTYSPLLKLCCKRKWLKMLNYLLADMFRKDVSLDLGTYTLLVQGLSRNGKLQHSCLFFEEMVQKGFVPWRNTYSLLIEALERRNMDAEKKKIHQLMWHAQNAKWPKLSL